LKRSLVRTSKFLSYVLRHRPDEIGIELDPGGWVAIADLLRCANQAGHGLTSEALHEVVQTNDKRRFAISDDGLKIRASQGHSIDVDLGLDPREPPTLLYHGTASRHLDSIRGEGLLPRNRQYVHLSLDIPTATAVGSRHGAPVVLTVHAARMHADGHAFFLSHNGIWMTAAVPAAYLEFPEDPQKLIRVPR